MKKCKLGDVIAIQWGNTSLTKDCYRSDGFQAFSAAGPDGYADIYEFDGPGIVLSAIGARCGRCFWADGKWLAIKNTITLTNPSSDLDLRFLFHLITRDGFWPNKGGAQPFIGLGEAKSIEIRIPPLSEQKRIAAILDKADNLRRKRQQAIHLSNDFLHAVFLDMFGDPVGKDGNRVSLGKLIDIDAPMVDPRLDEYADMLHVGPDRIEKDTGRLLKCQTAREEGLISKKFLFDESYVLYSKIRPYLKKCALATFTGLCSADMYPVRPKIGVATREFIWALLLSSEFDRYVVSLPDRANIPKLNRGELNAFEFNLPSIQKQEKFSAIVQKRIAYTNLLDCSYSDSLRLANSLLSLLL